MSGLNFLKSDKVSKNVKEMILENIVLISSSSLAIDEIIDILIEDYDKNLNARQLLASIKEEYLNAKISLGQIFLNYGFIEKKEILLFENNEDDILAMKSVLKLRVNQEGSAEKTVFFIFFTPFLWLFIFFTIISFASGAIKATIQSILVPLQSIISTLKIDYPVYIENEWFGYMVSILMIAIALGIIYSYYWYREHNLKVVYEIFPIKAYEDMPIILNTMQTLHEAGKKELDTASMLSVNIEPKGLRKGFREMASSRNRHISFSEVLKTIGVPFDIVSILQAQERTGKLYEKSIEDEDTNEMISQLEWLSRYCTKKAKRRLFYLTDKFLFGIGLGGVAMIMALTVVVLLILDSVEMFGQLQGVMKQIKAVTGR